jgi:hypothetical protein
MQRLKRMGEAAHYGSAAKIAERIERPVAKRTPFSLDTLRSLVGALLVFFAARRVVRAVRAGLHS